MFRSFHEIEKHLISNKISKKIVFCGSQDDIGLRALVRAKRTGFVTATLIGDYEKTVALLREMDEPVADYEIINETREMRIASTAAKMVRSGLADIPMKGLIQTAPFLMAIKDPIGGLADPDALINEYTVFFFSEQDRLILAGDCAVNIAPSLDEKVKILRNLISLAKAYQCATIKVAAVSVIEKPDPTIQSSLDAAALSKMDWGKDVLVEGPLALDNAISAAAAAHKGISSAVAGNADILLMPDIHAGNIFHKCVNFLSHLPFASGTVGANCPVIMNSRTDDEDSKFNSIMSGILQSV